MNQKELDSTVQVTHDLLWCLPHGYPQPYEGSRLCLRRFISLDHQFPDIGDCVWFQAFITVVGDPIEETG